MTDFFDKLGDLFFIVFVMGLPAVLIFGRPYYRRWMDLKEKQLEAESRLAAEKAAQYAAPNKELEQRVQVLERIATDRGVDVAHEIELLRGPAHQGS